MQDLINEINELGYPVSLSQYSFGKWRWQAIASVQKTPGGASFMEYVAFGDNAGEALQSLLDKIKEGKAAEAARKMAVPPAEDYSDLA